MDDIHDTHVTMGLAETARAYSKASVTRAYPQMPGGCCFRSRERFVCGIVLVLSVVVLGIIALATLVLSPPEGMQMSVDAFRDAELKGYNQQWVFRDTLRRHSLVVFDFNARPELQAPRMSESLLAKFTVDPETGLVTENRLLLPGASARETVTGHGSLRMEYWVEGKRAAVAHSDESAGFFQVQFADTDNCFHMATRDLAWNGPLNFTGQRELWVNLFTSPLVPVSQSFVVGNSWDSFTVDTPPLLFVPRDPGKCGERVVSVYPGPLDTGRRYTLEDTVTDLSVELEVLSLDWDAREIAAGALNVTWCPDTQSFAHRQCASHGELNCSRLEPAGRGTVRACEQFHRCVGAHARAASGIVSPNTCPGDKPCSCFANFASFLTSHGAHGCSTRACWSLAYSLRRFLLDTPCTTVAACPRHLRPSVVYPCTVEDECSRLVWATDCKPFMRSCRVYAPAHCLHCFNSTQSFVQERANSDFYATPRPQVEMVA